MKKTVLFVDDEPSIIQGLKRMLRSMRNEWSMLFAENGEDALNILSVNHVDVVVSDMRMPGMHGAELLGKVMERYPHIVRIILSGHSDQEMLLLSAKTAHQFLAKPCNADTLKHTIEHACLLRDLLKDENLVKVVTGIDRLPSLPSLYIMLVEEMQLPDASLKKVGDIIAQDVTMTAKVLQFVNSAFFGLPQKVTSPQQAAILLGLETLKALVLHVQVFSTFNVSSRTKFYIQELWQHSAMMGNLAKEIARVESGSRKMLDDALIAAILHDIGKLLLLEVPGYYERVGGLVKEKGCRFFEAEYELWGTSHAEVGAYLLGLWGLPDTIVIPVAFHHSPVKLQEKDFTVLTAVHAADALLFQENCLPESTVFPYIDLPYIESLNLIGRLPAWAECCSRIRKNGSGV